MFFNFQTLASVVIAAKFDMAALDQVVKGMAKQVNYATVLALTRTAQDAQAEVRRQLPTRFTIRTGWLSQAVGIVSATKDNLVSQVTDINPFMALQETGGEKTSFTGKAMGVPVGARPTKRSIVGPSLFPHALMEQKGYFIAPISPGSKVFGVWKRTRPGHVIPGEYVKGQRRPRDFGMKLMFVFKRAVQIEPRFGFMDTVRMTAEANLRKQFFDALKEALETAKF